MEISLSSNWGFWGSAFRWSRPRPRLWIWSFYSLWLKRSHVRDCSSCMAKLTPTILTMALLLWESWNQLLCFTNCQKFVLTVCIGKFLSLANLQSSREQRLKVVSGRHRRWLIRLNSSRTVWTLYLLCRTLPCNHLLALFICRILLVLTHTLLIFRSSLDLYIDDLDFSEIL